ncbi:MAG: peptidoglycan glycosyltransferase [Treponema sp. CETP13]|nr:MAG: peptidoglycan glycosyltransferase [Treponema sp. CETP13]
MQINHFFKPRRLVILGIVFVALLFYIIFTFGKLAAIPVTAKSQQVEVPQRGGIYDKNGKTLAIESNFYHIAVQPSAIRNLNEFATYLAPVTDLTKEEIISKINNAPIDFLYLEKSINRDKKDIISKTIKEHTLSGIYFDEIPGRIYPENALASQVIGYMGNAGTGLSGIEYTMQNILQPSEEMIKKGSSNIGNNIFLTIDANLQYQLEEIAQKAMEETQAESFMLISANAKTGEILSYISLPSANLNEYPQSTKEEQKDLPAMAAYEPGSVFKIFTVATALQTGAITPEQKFVCDGGEWIYGTGNEKAYIKCLGHHGTITAREALMYSCNDVLVQIAEKISTDDFLSYINKFGFGSKTGLQRPGETAGSVKDKYDPLWSFRSKPTMAIGQEISVSALQMVQATTAIANKGIPVKLTLVSKITDPNANVVYQHKPEYKKRIIDENVAKQILSYMQTVAEKGTGFRAHRDDIDIGVKTGTAQILDPETGTYSTTDFVSNCMSIFPIDDPQIILYIVISKAKGETYSGRIVAPIIGEAADVIIDQLGLARGRASSITHTGKIVIPPSKDYSIDRTVPDFTGAAKRELTHLFLNKNIQVLIHGEGYVISQSPEPGTPVTENMKIELFLE